MEAESNTQHSGILKQNAIAKQDVTVTDYVPSTPVYDEPYFSPDLQIILCHQGKLWGTDMTESIFEAHDVCILLPDQIATINEISEDYQATIINVSRQFYDQLLLSYPYTRNAPRYRRAPSFHLNEAQYNSLLDATSLLRTLTQIQSPHRTEMLTNLLAIMINMIGEYHVSNHPKDIKISSSGQLFSRCYDALIQHHNESHEVAFYARICCLSAKHFSDVIKHETGLTASEWITTYIVMRAKTLIDKYHEYTMQQISELLGFSEQSAFTRFFKRETGMTPSRFRDR